MKRRNQTLAQKLTAGAFAVGAAAAHAQYAPPQPAQPFPGFINQYLRQENPYLSAWDIGGNERLRYEAKSGYGMPGVTGSIDFRDHGADVSNDYLMSKLRFHVGYTDKWWSAYAEGRSSLVAGDERFAYFASPLPPGTVNRKGDGPEADAIDLQQAFVTLGNHKEFPLSLKLGRQELIYGEERLVGASAWNNIGRVFDAVKLRWQTEWFGADFFSSRVVIPEDTTFNVNNDYDWFSGMYATSTTLVPKNLLDVYFLARNASQSAISAEPNPQFPQPSARDIYTLGFRLKSKPLELGHWDYTLESAYQFGDFRDRRLGVTSARLDHEAWMLVAQGGYTWADVWGAPRLGLEYSFASGDSNPTDGKHETFENLFPTNHKFYGYMDLVSLQNIHDIRSILTLKPHPLVSVALEGHAFWLADTHDNFYTVAGAPRGGLAATPGSNFGINPNYSSFVGTELDAIAGVAVNKFTQFEVGYGHFFAGDYIAQSLSAPGLGSKDADFVYAQLSVNF
jgi:Alginate export